MTSEAQKTKSAADRCDSKTHRARDSIEKTRDEKKLNAMIRDNIMVLKRLEQDRLKLEQQKRRLDSEKAWTQRKFSGNDIALACRQEDRPGEPIQEINLRKVGTIVFGVGGFTPQDSYKMDQTKSKRILDELQKFKQKAEAAKARPVTVISSGNVTTPGNKTSRLSLDSYLNTGFSRDKLETKVPEITYKHPQELRVKSLPAVNSDLATDNRTVVTMDITDKSKDSRSNVSMRTALHRARAKRIRSFDASSINSEMTSLQDLLTQGPSLSKRDSILITQFINRQLPSHKNDDELRINLQRIIDNWKMKNTKMKRALKNGSDETAAQTQFFDNDYDWRFILQLLRRLRFRVNHRAASPSTFLQCSYLRLSDTNVSQLEKLSRDKGREPDIHAFSKPNEYDPSMTNIFSAKNPSIYSDSTQFGFSNKTPSDSTSKISSQPDRFLRH